MKNKSEKEKQKTLKKTYWASVTLPEHSALQISFLSRAMIHLWNRAHEECEKRLAARKNISAGIAAWKEKSEEEKEAFMIQLPGGERVPMNQAGPKLEMLLTLHELGVSAYSLNYWLTDERNKEVVLEDGTAIRLDAISVDMEREVLRKLAGSYESHFELRKTGDRKTKRPRPKKEEEFQALSWSSFSIKDGAVYVPGYQKERITIPLDEHGYLKEYIEGKEVVFVTLSKNYQGEYILNMVTTSPLPKLIENPRFFRAIDLGAGNIAVVDSDGTEFLPPTRRSDKFWHGEVVPAIEARLKNKEKDSVRYNRLMEGRRAAFEINKQQHTSHQRKLARAFLEPEDAEKELAVALLEKKVECVIVGKPNTRLGLAKSEGTGDQHYGAQNTGYMFRMLLFIKEKAEEFGIRLIQLPDPRRKGDLSNAEHKLHAARTLLAQGLVKSKSNIPMPTSFTLKHFKFSEGKTAPPIPGSRKEREGKKAWRRRRRSKEQLRLVLGLRKEKKMKKEERRKKRREEERLAAL